MTGLSAIGPLTAPSASGDGRTRTTRCRGGECCHHRPSLVDRHAQRGLFDRRTRGQHHVGRHRGAAGQQRKSHIREGIRVAPQQVFGQFLAVVRGAAEHYRIDKRKTYGAAENPHQIE